MSPDDATVTLIRGLAERSLTVAVAESLTGGELAAELTRPAGASAVFLGGVVVYATELKHRLAGVDDALLAEHGPVHPEVARQLAEGVRLRLGVDTGPAAIGVSTTGVAGPQPQGDRPVGCVFVGIADASGTRVSELALSGDRASIRRQVVDHVVGALMQHYLSPTTGGSEPE